MPTFELIEKHDSYWLIYISITPIIKIVRYNYFQDCYLFDIESINSQNKEIINWLINNEFVLLHQIENKKYTLKITTKGMLELIN